MSLLYPEAFIQTVPNMGLEVLLYCLLPPLAGGGFAFFLTTGATGFRGHERVRFTMLRTLALVPLLFALLGLTTLRLMGRGVGDAVKESLALAMGMAGLSSSISTGLILRGASGEGFSKHLVLASIPLTVPIYALALIVMQMGENITGSSGNAISLGALIFTVLALFSVLSGVLPSRVEGDITELSVYQKKVYYAVAGTFPAMMGVMLYILLSA